MTARVPVTGEEVSLAANIYADDLEEAVQGEDMEEVIGKITASSDGFDEAIAGVGLTQNTSKMEAVPHVAGRGPVAEMDVTRGWGREEDTVRWIGPGILGIPWPGTGGLITTWTRGWRRWRMATTHSWPIGAGRE